MGQSTKMTGKFTRLVAMAILGGAMMLTAATGANAGQESHGFSAHFGGGPVSVEFGGGHRGRGKHDDRWRGKGRDRWDECGRDRGRDHDDRWRGRGRERDDDCEKPGRGGCGKPGCDHRACGKPDRGGCGKDGCNDKNCGGHGHGGGWNGGHGGKGKHDRHDPPARRSALGTLHIGNECYEVCRDDVIESIRKAACDAGYQTKLVKTRGRTYVRIYGCPPVKWEGAGYELDVVRYYNDVIDIALIRCG